MGWFDARSMWCGEVKSMFSVPSEVLMLGALVFAPGLLVVLLVTQDVIMMFTSHVCLFLGIYLWYGSSLL